LSTWPRYREELLKGLKLEVEDHEHGIDVASTADEDLGAIRIRHVERDWTTPFSYYVGENGIRRNELKWSLEEEDRLRRLLPLLAEPSPTSLLAASAFRALAREEKRGLPRDDKPGSSARIEREIAEWVGGGYPPPGNMRIEHAAFFEEEACRAYLMGAFSSDRLELWRELGLFQSERPEIDLEREWKMTRI